MRDGQPRLDVENVACGGGEAVQRWSITQRGYLLKAEPFSVRQDRGVHGNHMQEPFHIAGVGYRARLAHNVLFCQPDEADRTIVLS